METLIHILFNTTISMSILIIVFLLISPLLAKRYSARWRYYSWLVVVVGLLFPFRPSFDTALIQFKSQLMTSSPADQIALLQEPAFEANQVQALPTADPNSLVNKESVDLYSIILTLWVLGILVVGSSYIINHIRFLTLIKRWSKEITSSEVTHLLLHIQRNLNLSQSISLRTCPFISSPMMVGYKQTQILLPHSELSHNELELVFVHELIHMRRRDLWYKALVTLVTIIYWFNPFVHLMSRAISNECEISCDEEVIRYKKGDNRKLYGETILSFTIQKVHNNSVFSTQMFGGGKKEMKTRIAAIMDKRPKKKGYVVLLAAIISIMMSGVVFAYKYEDHNPLSDYRKQLHAEIEQKGYGWQAENNTMWYAGNPNFQMNTLERFKDYGILYDSVKKDWTYKGNVVHMFRDGDDRYLNFSDEAIQHGVSIKVNRAWNTHIEGLEVMTKEDQASLFEVEPISRDEFELMNQIIMDVNSGILPESALLEAQPLLKRKPYSLHSDK